MDKPKYLPVLQSINFFVLLVALGIIAILHIKTNNFLDVLRLPRAIGDLDPLLGLKWPISLYAYQIILVFALIVAFVNSLGLFIYKSKLWRILSDLLSFLGLLVIWPASLFLIFALTSSDGLSNQNIQTIYIYLGFTYFIAILDLITWFVDEQSIIKRAKNNNSPVV